MDWPSTSPAHCADDVLRLRIFGWAVNGTPGPAWLADLPQNLTQRHALDDSAGVLASAYKPVARCNPRLTLERLAPSLDQGSSAPFP